MRLLSPEQQFALDRAAEVFRGDVTEMASPSKLAALRQALRLAGYDFDPPARPPWAGPDTSTATPEG